ncbi:hypothetical protein GALL_535650 [mine drainage metagenome]|uniref:Uncharacterized protein n=1 Tax=mine drainage metagenome TaxID=410659 RepID=A0A1J5PBM1_9ZZZZ
MDQGSGQVLAQGLAPGRIGRRNLVEHGGVLHRVGDQVGVRRPPQAPEARTIQGGDPGDQRTPSAAGLASPQAPGAGFLIVFRLRQRLAVAAHHPVLGVPEAGAVDLRGPVLEIDLEEGIDASAIDEADPFDNDDGLVLDLPNNGRTDDDVQAFGGALHHIADLALGEVVVQQQEVLAARRLHAGDIGGGRGGDQQMIGASPVQASDLDVASAQLTELAGGDVADHDPPLRSIGPDDAQLLAVRRALHLLDVGQFPVGLKRRGLGPRDAEGGHDGGQDHSETRHGSPPTRLRDCRATSARSTRSRSPGDIKAYFWFA